MTQQEGDSGITVNVVGGGLAGCEATLLLAAAGVAVRLYEMRPHKRSPAHETDDLAELVCSNSLRSDDPKVAVGLLKEEMRRLGSPVMAAADRHKVPAGAALATDRTLFARDLTQQVQSHPLVTLIRQEVTHPPPGLTILAPGPLAAEGLIHTLREKVGGDRLYFYDAIAPIVEADSLNMDSLFLAERYGDGQGEGDYLNAAMDREAYTRFVQALLEADRWVPHEFDADEHLAHFTGCEPIEAIARRGFLSLAHGPMKPVGLRFNEKARGAFAVVQMRAENHHRTAFNLVGFQTRLRQAEQKRVFQMIPGLEKATFLRYGSVHRNSYLDSPRLVNGDLSLRAEPEWFVAGQFAGAEGYVESTALGMLAALFVLGRLRGGMVSPPGTTALGALLTYVTTSTVDPLQPSNIHYGLFPPTEGRGKGPRRTAMVERARQHLHEWLEETRFAGLTCRM